MLNLNLGCGREKIEGCINIDCEESCKPDLVHDFTKAPLPYEDESVDEVYMFHVIEHIRKPFHPYIFREIARVLKKDGVFYLSFPEFTKCVDRWRQNYKGDRKFWEATIFGRQMYPSDYHICIMDVTEVTQVLFECGFEHITARPEPVPNEFNTVMKSIKLAKPYKNYEELVKENIEQTEFTA